MSIDISQFHEVFFEESFEGLEIMENSLLGLSESDDALDVINNIFRAAHSIKGGSATFGFMEISKFTHVMETLLDEMRNNERPVTVDAVELLLEATDVLSGMLTQVQDDEELDSERIKNVQGQLETMLGVAPEADVVETVANEDGAESGWTIKFIPLPHLLSTGNDPVRMFRELAALGDMTVSVNIEALPQLAELEPEECFISWSLELNGDIEEQQVAEVFDWVDGDCELVIQKRINEIDDSEDKNPEMSGDNAEKPAEAEQLKDVAKQDRREKPERRSKKPKAAEASSIRVGIDKIDILINMVGELVITQSMLSQMGESADENSFDAERIEKLQDGLSQLERNTRELQEAVMQIRMLPISFAFNRFPRVVHDYCRKSGKKIELVISGEQTELDKTVMEKINDPLVHLVRNSMDHGVETPEVRLASGKPETGTVMLDAYHKGGSIVIEIKDDGAGINKDRILSKGIEKGLVSESDVLTDEQVFDLLFLPGFSTAKEVTDVSGRGVGMDVVRRNIKSLGGNIEVTSTEGKGSTFTIRLPLTLAILDGQLIRVGNEMYIIPLTAIVESIQINEDRINGIASGSELYKLRNEYIPVVRMHESFGVEAEFHELTKGLLVVVEGDEGKVGIFVDRLLGQQQVVIKSLETNFKGVPGVSGATILGDGTVALIVDIAGLVSLAQSKALKNPYDIAEQSDAVA
ncbi:MAG: chemotaxis protein CheA [Gammaproteobacteria bacterium]